MRSGSISRVLSWTIISLGWQLLTTSSRSTRESDGSEKTVMKTIFSLLDLAPGGVYLATTVTRDAGALLPHRFTLTCPPTKAGVIGGLLSVALARSSQTVGVTHHRILWSPDFPPQITFLRTLPAATA